MYGETALQGSLPALFHDILQFMISRIFGFPGFQNPDFGDYIFHFSVVGTPVYTENIKKRRQYIARKVVSLIQPKNAFI